MATGTATSALRELDDDGLLTRLTEAKEELFNLRFQAATGQLESHGRLRAVRKDIARIYTIMRERELGITPVDITDIDVDVDGADGADSDNDEVTA